MTRQAIGDPYAGGVATITTGDPAMRSLGHYGKGDSFMSPAESSLVTAPDTATPAPAGRNGSHGSQSVYPKPAGGTPIQNPYTAVSS